MAKKCHNYYDNDFPWFSMIFQVLRDMEIVPDDFSMDAGSAQQMSKEIFKKSYVLFQK